MASTSSSSVTASPSIQGWTYDVFLSFRGPDTRKTFIDFLYDSLERKGIRTFKDYDRLEIGDCISPSLLKVIEESLFLIAVFSKGYASSKWCLEELATMMECHEKFKKQIVVPIFYHVEPSDVRNQKGSFEDPFKELVEKIGKDDEEKVRRWKVALKKAGKLKGHHLMNDYNGDKEKCAEGVAADIFVRLNQQLSLPFEERLVGLESRVYDIGKWVTLVSDYDVRFIGICGMGGIGKTTTAMVVFNRFYHQFDGSCFLADVRQHNAIELQKALLTNVLKEKSKVEISNAQDGKAKIRMKLKGKKVLIVLDDVDNQLEQLDKLAGGGDWFGRGSRVIITTRDKGILRGHGVDEKYIYEVHTLEDQKAFQLFSYYAFKSRKPAADFKPLSRSIVHYAKGLPLALKVLGSTLNGLEAAEWVSTLEELKDTSNDYICMSLKISFDRLDSRNKKIFLHIACFFRHEKEEYVKDVLKSCDLQAVDSAMRNLTENYLISVLDDGRIEMHDLIQKMGWDIARHEYSRSRVWEFKEVYDVLCRNMDPKPIEGIECKVSGWGDRSFEISMREMTNLKMLKVGHGFHLEENYLPSSLRCLQFDFYQFTSLPKSFASSNLVCLSLRYSSLQNCRITQKLDKLTLLDLRCSSSLLETPDFDSMPNLMKLNLEGCNNLKVVHSSIGNLSKLVLLDLSECSKLESLPSFNQVSSLNSLDLCNCIELKVFPEIKAKMPHLVELDLLNVGIIELPSSIKQLHGLTKLGLYVCKHLECLCDGLCELKNLKVLKIQNCGNLKSLPENVKSLNSLEYLSLKGSNFDSLPESFNQLPRLQYLDIRYCSKLIVLPKLPKTLSQLYADPSFAFHGNIADVAKRCSGLHSLAFSFDYERWTGHFLAKMCIHFPFQRKTPCSVNFPVSPLLDPITRTDALRLFQYRCYDSNGISIDLNFLRYCKSFVGFGVYFFSSENDIWKPQCGQDIDGMHCTVIAKLSRKDNGNEVVQRKCVIVKTEGNNGIDGDVCFLYIPFSSLWLAESNTNINSVSPNDFSRFEMNFMNLKATADWGCSLLYKRRKRPCSWDDSHQGCTTDIGPLVMLNYLNLNGKEFKHFSPEDISRLRVLQYLDISGCKGVIELPELPATIRELYAAYNKSLASESNIVELATKYSELYSVSFSKPIYDDYRASLVPRELAKKFIPIIQSFLNRNTPFSVTYPLEPYSAYNISGCFKYPHLDPHKISISLDTNWYSHNFVGFIVYFVFPKIVRWESYPNIRPFRYCELITKLIHKDNESEPPLQTKCVIGRLYDKEFDNSDELVCFAYIPFSSLWPKSKAITDTITSNHYLIFEATIQDLEFSTHWSCDLLYTDDESLTDVIRQEREVGSSYMESSSSKSDSEEWEDEDEEETEEEEDDGGSEHIEDSGGDGAMTQDNGGDDAMVEDINQEETYGFMASTSSVTASPSAEGWTYDVFLSFRGSDTRKTFIDFLYDPLERKGIRTFKEDDRLEKGDCIPPSQLKAIKESQFLIAVFSKGYALSKWCLEELATMMECHEKFKEQIVVPIFYNVEPSDVRKQEGSFGDSFKELEKMVNDNEGKVRKWREALKRAVDLKGLHLQDDYNGSEATCAEKVAAYIHARLNHASLAFEENLVGLESRVNNIGNWLRLASDDNDDDVRFIGICGMGGIGKTTIAMAVFNRFLHQFDGACFLANVRQHNIIELQKTLLTEVLKEKSGVQISSVQDGKAKIRMRLKGKKVLIVLDDVDNQLEQLDELAGGGDWFGRDSRVIITIRDAAVLHSHGVVHIYEVQTLEEQEAIQLFKLHAFKKEPAKIGVEELCGSIVYYCKGLPLALKVLGSSLCGLEAADWKGTLEQLMGTPNDDIDTKLKICFDRLDSNSKNIFLYIACFFRHEREEYVKDVLKSCDLQTFIGMRILIEKSLISVLEGRIEMHDLIQEMGWHIASLDIPRNRVWQLKDVDDVLSGKRDPNDKKGILLPSVGDINEENISELKWLDFKFYSFTSLPAESFIPSKLVWFSLHHSYLENCRINQKLDKLIYLDLSSSYSLLETPDFDWMPNLMRLNLSDCQKLKMIHSSIGNLRKLILLDLSKCHDLKRLPSFNQVSSLRSLNLLGCIRLENFPEIETRTPHLVELDLKMVGIKELSSSMQKLHGLTRLCLDQCPHLVCLCNDMCELKSLKVLEIKNCRNLKSLPENLDGLISLEYLNFQGCCFDSLPESFSQLTCLQYLSITDCEIPKDLPKLPANIKELYADCGFKIAELAMQYSKLNLVSFSTGDQHGVVTSLAKKFIHFPLHRETPFCASYRINSVDLEKSKMLRTFKYRHYKSNGICINLDSSWYSKIFMGFVVCFFEKNGNIWGRHSNQAIDNSIRSCTVIVKLSHKDNKDEILQIDCVIAVSSFDNSDDTYGTLCCAYIPVRSLWGESKAIKDYSRFEVQFKNFKSSADWGCSLLYERQIGATKHKGYHGGTDSGLTTDDIGCLSSLGLGMEYLNLNRRDLACLPKLTYLQYLDISGCRRLIMLPTLPRTIKELYAHSNLASESNIAKLAITYPELYSVSFSHGYATVSAEELARKFVRVPIQIRNSPFVVTYPACDDLADIDTKRWFKYTSHCSNEISINLKSSWYNEIFMGFVVCFLLQGTPQRWESHPEIRPFRHCKVIAKLKHEDNANEVLQKDCVIGRLYDEEFDDEFEDCQFICFAYIPSSSLLSKYEGDPNDYSVFEVAFLDSSNSSDWSCGLLYKDELLSEAIRSNIYTDTLKSQQELGNEGEDERKGDEEDGHEWKQRKKARLDKGQHITKSWQLTKILLPRQCQMVSMPDCFDAKVARLLYTKSGVGIMALNLDGILKLWKWPHNKQNPSAKATANFVPQYWQTNSGLLIDVSGVNTMEVFPCIALSNDGYFVALAFGEKVSLFSMNTFRFQEMTTFKLPSASTCLAHDPCAYEIIAIGTKGSTIYLYNFAKEKVITKLKGHQNCITGLAFSTNPYMLVSSGADAQLCKWNILGRWKKRISVRIELPAGEVFSGDTQVMFHVDQLHLLVTHKTQLAIYDASKMERISQWIPHGPLSTPISSATYSSNSLLVYASFNDGNIGVFDAHSLRLRCCIAPSAYLSPIVPDRSGGVYPVAIAAHPQKTNQFAIGLTNGSVKVIEPREFERKWGVSLTIDNDPIQCRMVSMPECFDAKVKVAQILYTKSGVDILALSSNGFYKLWKWFHHEQNPSRKATANSLPQHWQTYSGLHVSVVNLVEVVPCIALSNDGSFVALAAGEKVSLFDMETFEEKVTFICQSASTFLAFHPRHNNILAIGMEDSTINIYNAWDKEVMVNLKGAQKRITGLAFSTNLEMLVSSGADARLCAWSIDTWEMRISVPIQLPASELEVPSRDTHVMFHADQLHLLVTHETQLAIYDASKMECISQWIPHDCLCAPISSATYSCNNQLVYASFKDGNIGVLDFDKPNSLRLRCRIAPFAYLSKVNSDGVYAVVIAAHPQEPYQLAIGLTDGSVKVIEPLESEGEWRISPPVDIETLNEDEDDESDEDVEEYEAKESNAGNSVELAAEYNDSERIDDDEEASITEKSVKDAALFGEIHEPNPIIWKDHNYHIEEDHETTTSQHELGPNKIKQWEFTAIVDRDQCRMVSMSDCFDAKVVRLFYTNSGVSILALSSDGIQKLWKWLNNEQNPTGKATANYVPQNWQSNSGLLMINDVVGVDLENVVPCIALSNDDSYIVSSVGGKVSLFNIMTFEVTKTITLPSASTFLAFDPHDDNIIAIGTEKSTIYIYDRIDEELNELGEHHKPITGLAFSTNLKLLVSSDADAQLCSWNTRLWRKKRSVRIQLPAGEVCSGDTHVMFHVDQLHLLVTHETQLAIYDASKMERINQWIPNGSFSAPISCATYSCNCQLIYATLKDGNIGVFDAHGLRPRCCIAPCAYLSQVILNRSESVYAVAIAAHPQYPNQFAIGLTDGSVKVIEPLESQRQWGISPPVDIEILNEKSVLTQLELGTGEAEQIKPNPANEDCEAKVHSNKCALIRCFWKCC